MSWWLLTWREPGDRRLKEASYGSSEEAHDDAEQLESAGCEVVELLEIDDETGDIL